MINLQACFLFLHRDFSVSKHVSVQEQTDSFSPSRAVLLLLLLLFLRIAPLMSGF